MKQLAAGAAAAVAVLLALAGPAAAQIYPPQPDPAAARPAGADAAAGLPPWMRDDGSSSDYPTHTPSDFVADGLNAQYRNGLTAIGPPGASGRADPHQGRAARRGLVGAHALR